MANATFSNNTKAKDHEKPLYEENLTLRDILPIKTKLYDKNRAPKLQGQPTIVYFHVTVLSLDSINEESMVSSNFCFRGGFFRYEASAHVTYLLMQV